MKNNLIGISGKIGAGKDLVGSIIQYLTSNYNDGEHTFEEYLEDIKKRNDSPYFNKYQIKKFADKLKDIVCMLIGCTREQLEDREFKEKELGEEWKVYHLTYSQGVSEQKIFSNWEESEDFLRLRPLARVISGWYETLTPRKLLQLMGTECGRDIIHPNIWVNSLFADYKPTGDNLLEGEVRKVREEDLIYPNWIITDCRFPNEAKAVKDRGGVVIRINRKQVEHHMPLNWYQDLHKENMLNGDITEIERCFHPSETALDDYQDFTHVIENDGSVEDLIEKIRNLNLV